MDSSWYSVIHYMWYELDDNDTRCARLAAGIAHKLTVVAQFIKIFVVILVKIFLSVDKTADTDTDIHVDVTTLIVTKTATRRGSDGSVTTISHDKSVTASLSRVSGVAVHCAILQH